MNNQLRYCRLVSLKTHSENVAFGVFNPVRPTQVKELMKTLNLSKIRILYKHFTEIKKRNKKNCSVIFIMK